MSDPCPVPRCPNTINSSRVVMCWPCWRKVPVNLRSDVWAAWEARKAALDGLIETPYPAARERHEKAKAAAIAAVS